MENLDDLVIYQVVGYQEMGLKKFFSGALKNLCSHS